MPDRLLSKRKQKVTGKHAKVDFGLCLPMTNMHCPKHRLTNKQMQIIRSGPSPTNQREQSSAKAIYNRPQMFLIVNTPNDLLPYSAII